MRVSASGVLALLIWLGATIAPAASAGPARTLLVRDMAQYQQATASLRPGDTVVLADGTWRDARLVFKARGQDGQPVRLTAQTPGKVILSGQSDLRLAGEHLEVSNLVFRDGWAPGGEALSFRISRSERANHSRVTGVVIDGYSKPDRGEADHWVALYGHDNRFDHNQLLGKTNRGTTLVVVRDEEQGLDNRHRIDHNWFGPRPNLGSNGGETLRVGTSHDSLSDSHTVVEDNWFEGCDGEVEIVSNKSGGNIYRGNVFFHSRGSMVLRHGSGNLVERNVFLGGSKAHTGGVRVINARQTIRDNYFEGLDGQNFAAALSVMYGAVDAPKNRYAQVEHAVIERNTWIASRQLLLGTGMDDERNAAPKDSRFANNLIVNGQDNPLVVQGDISGIAFAGNVQSPIASPGFPDGVVAHTLAMTRAATGLQVPSTPLPGIGAPRDLTPIAREDVGVTWYPKDAARAALDRGRTESVAPGDDTLTRAVQAATPGQRLQLRAGRYTVNEVLALSQPLTVQGPAQGAAELQFSRPVLFELLPGASLRLAHLTVDGAQAPDEAGNAVIRIAPGANTANYTVLIEDSRLVHLDGNRGFDVINAGKGTMADLIALRHVLASDVSGRIVSAAAETDDGGTYNAERVEIVGSQFTRIGGAVVDLYRGGTDESTFGPALDVRDSTFRQVGRRDDASLRLRGVQHVQLVGNTFDDSAAVRFTHAVGTPTLVATRNTFAGTPAIQSDIPVEATR
ncbi:poly(beta-D-mannuronate) lyase [Pseudoxanthomonas sp. GM95]|uniref:polysaccharide lyase 6 family protein n=1 Tax=Pseudoxanthomonas sp. GM95 TaxID=1881043 RepID=UPI0008B3956B|nr:polysaccharide lyase 6 family protein [Pseudoxanthomonas sp. GM95]SEL61690.1 poly(beta-D-mannuronate) lyase [Pseudoxanthomonas sp. GM95]